LPSVTLWNLKILFMTVTQMMFPAEPVYGVVDCFTV